MILESYYHFNAEEFIKSLKGLKRRRLRLLEELDSIPEIPAVNNATGVRGSEPSDLTGRLAIRRVAIQQELDGIDSALSAYDYAKSMLTPTEREVIELFFEPKKPIWREIEDYTGSNYICRGNLYKLRRLALNRIEEIVSEKYLK